MNKRTAKHIACAELAILIDASLRGGSFEFETFDEWDAFNDAMRELENELIRRSAGEWERLMDGNRRKLDEFRA